MHKTRLRALEGRRVSSKSPSRVKTETRELLEGRKRTVSPVEIDITQKAYWKKLS